MPVFLSGKFQGQRSLVGYSHWGRKALDTTELLSKNTHTLLKYKRFLFFLIIIFISKLHLIDVFYYFFQCYLLPSTAMIKFYCWLFSLCLLPLHHLIVLFILFFLLTLWFAKYLKFLFSLSSLNDIFPPHLKEMRTSEYYTFLHHISFLVVMVWEYIYTLVSNQKPCSFWTLVL